MAFYKVHFVLFYSRCLQLFIYVFIGCLFCCDFYFLSCRKFAIWMFLSVWIGKKQLIPTQRLTWINTSHTGEVFFKDFSINFTKIELLQNHFIKILQKLDVSLTDLSGCFHVSYGRPSTKHIWRASWVWFHYCSLWYYQNHSRYGRRKKWAKREMNIKKIERVLSICWLNPFFPMSLFVKFIVELRPSSLCEMLFNGPLGSFLGVIKDSKGM